MLMEGWIGLEEIQLCLCWLSKAPTLGWFEEALMTPVFSHWRPLSCSWKDGLDKRKSNKDLSNNTQSHILSEWSISGQFQDLTHVSPMGNCWTQNSVYTALCSAHVSCPEMGGREGGQRWSATFSRWCWLSLVRTHLECKSTATLTYCYTLCTIGAQTLYFSVS